MYPWHEIFTLTDYDAMIAENNNLDCERTCKFRVGWQNVLRVDKKLCDKK